MYSTRTIKVSEWMNSSFYYIIITITIVKNNDCYTWKYLCIMVAKEAFKSLLCWLPQFAAEIL